MSVRLFFTFFPIALLLPDERQEVATDASVFWLLNAQKCQFARRANNMTLSGF